jgi:hypothetical protein
MHPVPSEGEAAGAERFHSRPGRAGTALQLCVDQREFGGGADGLGLEFQRAGSRGDRLVRHVALDQRADVDRRD